MLSTGLVIHPLSEFEYAKERLIGCCEYENSDKLKLYKLANGNYRINCDECCAYAEGTSLLEVINNYEFGKFTVQPM